MSWSNLYTKRQIVHLLAAKGLPVRLPSKKLKIEFETDVDFVRISWTEKKGTYGDRLYEYETEAK